MRIIPGTFLLRGARRFAVYNSSRKIAYPLSLNGSILLESLAAAKTRQARSTLSRVAFTSALTELTQCGIIEAGRESVSPVDLPHIDRIVKQRMSQVWFELTDSCNLTCQHCYAESSPKAPRGHELDYLKWQIITRKILSYGCDRITFIGGEPLIRSELILRLCEWIRNEGYTTELRIFSNLTLVDAVTKNIPAFKKYSISFGTSLYGMDAETHDKVTGNTGSHAKTLTSIRHLKDAGFNLFGGFYLDENMRRDSNEITNWLTSLRIDKFEIIAPSKVGRGVNLDWKAGMTGNRIPEPKSFSYATLQESISGHNCFSSVFAVRSDGSVMPCIMTRSSMLPNLLTKSMADLVNSEEYKRWSTITKDHIEGCKDCEFRYACFDCRPDAMGDNDGNMLAKPSCGYDPYEDV